MTDQELLSAIRKIVKEELKESKKVTIHFPDLLMKELPDMSKYLKPSKKKAA